jgi:cobalt-zinc-cadmium efflux system membrane fusion protein
MKSTLFTIVIGAIFLVGGAGAVILADRQGWLPGAGGHVDRRQSAGCPHELTRELCPFCTPGLIEEMGQCGAHSVPEALCSRCNQALVPAFKVENDWCGPHEIPESQCTICNPGLIASQDVSGAAFGQPEDIRLISTAETPRNQRQPSVTCKTETLQIQFLNDGIADKAGFEYSRVNRQEVVETLSCNAEIVYDGNRYARLAPRAPGVVREVKKDLGDRVETGETLAVIDSADLGSAKAAYLQAQALLKLSAAEHAREKKLVESEISAQFELLEAQSSLSECQIAVSQAAQRLRNLGLSDNDIQQVEMGDDTSSLLPLIASFPGVVVERSTVIGEEADTTTPLFAVADTSTMWAMLDVYDRDIQKVHSGQTVVVAVEGARGEAFGGQVNWASSSVDPKTRTLKVRAEIANPDGYLRSGMFGTAEIRLYDQGPVPVVPKDAVQWEGCCNIVFVKQNDSLFRPKKVRLGYATERHFVVHEGLEPNDVVVTTGSFLLKTEILKGSIGAGCCEVEPGKQQS